MFCFNVSFEVSDEVQKREKTIKDEYIIIEKCSRVLMKNEDDFQERKKNFKYYEDIIEKYINNFN